MGEGPAVTPSAGCSGQNYSWLLETSAEEVPSGPMTSESVDGRRKLWCVGGGSMCFWGSATLLLQRCVVVVVVGGATEKNTHKLARLSDGREWKVRRKGQIVR